MIVAKILNYPFPSYQIFLPITTKKSVLTEKVLKINVYKNKLKKFRCFLVNEKKKSINSA